MNKIITFRTLDKRSVTILTKYLVSIEEENPDSDNSIVTTTKKTYVTGESIDSLENQLFEGEEE